MNLYEPSDESIKYSIKSAKDFFLILFFVLNRYDYSLPRYRRLKRIAISRFLNRRLSRSISDPPQAWQLFAWPPINVESPAF